jgi:hypothetical protein
MKIDSYSVQAASNRKFHSEDIEIRSVKQKTLNLTVPALSAKGGLGVAAEPVSLALSEDAKNLLQSMRTKQPQSQTPENAQVRAGRVSCEPTSRETHEMEARLNLLEALLYRLTGKKFSFRATALAREFSRESQPVAHAPQKQLVLTEEQFFSSHYESESLRYEATGLIKTADGRTISVDVGFNMSREFYTSVSGSLSTAEVQTTDPLVINFSGTAASLTERKFEFDLDADGKLDSISFAGEGNGFLALDRNGDGRINDGSELFGPQSGSGFGELRAYDADGNGWIDENDDIFSGLRVWSKDAAGNDILFTLKEADVGAIYLGDISTQYTLGGYGATDGTLRSTSIFLKESGGAGTISHIDLAV